jgi:predicted O-linked N-acetylglucosamine transferase (SPINDLY family)
MPKKLIFGTLARTEKFNSQVFLETVVHILKSCPDSIFLFTGKTPNEKTPKNVYTAFFL